jgi:hypothetical protein
MLLVFSGDNEHCTNNDLLPNDVDISLFIIKFSIKHLTINLAARNVSRATTNWKKLRKITTGHTKTTFNLMKCDTASMHRQKTNV